MDIRVLFVCYTDIGYVAHRICAALRRHTEVQARVWAHKSPIATHFKQDLVGRLGQPEAAALAAKADVIHFMDAGHPAIGGVPLPFRVGSKAKSVLSLNRSWWYLNRPESVQVALDNVMKDSNKCLLTALTANIPTGTHKALYTPQPIDVSLIPAKPREACRTRLVVGHMPYNLEKRKRAKGTDIINSVLSKHEKEIELRVISGVAPLRAMQMKAQFDVLIDQLVVGAYGYNALEAACSAVPVICYLRSPHPPIIECKPDGSDLLETLEPLKNPRNRRALGIASREFVEREHSYKAVAPMWEGIYANLDK